VERILLTGHSGFVGSRLLASLRTRGFEILTFPETLDLALAPPPRPESTPDAVIHLAALTPQTGKPEAEIGSVNTRITRNLLESLAGGGTGRIVYLNTNGYGIPRYLPVDEEHPLQLRPGYQESKYAGEEMTLDFADREKIRAASLRLFNPYGPGQREPFLIPAIIGAIRRNRPIELKEPESRRDYVYVDDVVAALEACLEADLPKRAIYNIGSGEARSNREIAELLRGIAGSDVPVRDIGGPGRAAYEVRADISRAGRELGWTPRVGIREGLRAAWEASGDER